MTSPSSGATPNEDTASEALRQLELQLQMAQDSFESIDRKAALLPPFLAGAVGLLLGPGDATFTQAQIALLLLALATGAVAGWEAVDALRTRKAMAGPTASEVAASFGRPVNEYRTAVADVLAKTIADRLSVNRDKARALNRAIGLSALTLLFVVAARIAGGIPMEADNADGANATERPAPASVEPSPSNTVAATPAPASAPTTAPTAQPSTTSVNAGQTEPGNPEPLQFTPAYEQKALTVADGVERSTVPKPRPVPRAADSALVEEG